MTPLAGALAPEILLVGAISGLGYGLVAGALLLAVRVGGILNLALAQVGAFSAIVLLVLRDAGLPYWPAWLVALAVGGLLAAAIQAGVHRRFASVPAAAGLIASLGVAEVLLRAGQLIEPEISGNGLYPGPPGVPAVQAGALTVIPSQVLLLALAPLLAGVAAWALRATSPGRLVRAVGADRQAAALLGIPVDRIVATAAVGCGVAVAVTATLVLPAGGFPAAEAFGPGLLLRVLTAAAVARFRSPAVALAAGIGVGVLESVVIATADVAALVPLVLLVVLVLGALGPGAAPLLARGTAAPSRWLAVQPRSGDDRGAGLRPTALVLLAAAPLPWLLGPADTLTLTAITCAAVVAVSAWMVAALVGELSLAQFAIAGVGACAAAATATTTGSAPVGFAVAIVVGAAAGGLLGVVARAGLGYVVTSLAFALVVAGPFLYQDWALGGGVEPARLVHGRAEVQSLALASLALVTGLGVRLVRSGFGRRARAARDAPAAAAGLGVPVGVLRVQLLAIAGGVAGLGGALLAQSVGTLRADVFTVTTSIQVVAVAVVGGLGAPSGAVLGAVLVLGLPALGGPSDASLVAGATFWLVVLVVAPGGLLTRLPGRAGRPGSRLPVPSPGGARPSADGVGITAAGISHDIGGHRVLGGLALAVEPGEAVAVLGANGSGKTTLLDVLAGAARPTEGRVQLDGTDVSILGAASRARSGLVHVGHQGAAFATMRVEDVVLLGAERRARPGFTDAVLGRGPAAAEAQAAADALAAVGLTDLAGRRYAELSTGQQRLVSLAAGFASAPSVLVLDEPAAGVAQAERAGLAERLSALRRARGTTLVVAEHDRALVDALTSEVLVLADGTLRPAAPEPVPEAVARTVDAPAERPPPPAAAVVACRDLGVGYAGRLVLRDVDLRLAPGELVALLGTNGAGKSTLLRAIAGLLPAACGRLEVLGTRAAATAEARARAGVRLVTADTPGFSPLTVSDALRAALPRDAGGGIASVLPDFPELDRQLGTTVGSLSGGDRHSLRLAQALLGRPRLLLVDELTLGLRPERAARNARLLAGLAASGTAVVAADQDADAMLRLAPRALFVDGGRLRFDGPSDALASRTDLLRPVLLR